MFQVNTKGGAEMCETLYHEVELELRGTPIPKKKAMEFNS
jgi:hypothetical protein